MIVNVRYIGNDNFTFLPSSVSDVRPCDTGTNRCAKALNVNSSGTRNSSCIWKFRLFLGHRHKSIRQFAFAILASHVELVRS